ncbi:MAG TPA: cupredoxin domain-containing protein [Beijerinckiaceae bacterium]|jgi:hypothetical protein
MTKRPATLCTACLIASGLFSSAASEAQEKRFFTIAAVEPRGGVNVGQELFPSEPLPLGGGYLIKQPDQTGRWEVSAYVWSPSQVIVHAGDDVTLEFVGINGAHHPTEIKGIDRTFTLKRGHVTRIEFKAEKAGIFPIVCSTHQPSMRGEIVVLPRP